MAPDPCRPHDRLARNFADLRSDLRRRRRVWTSRPAILEYAATSACNLRCPMCEQADPERRVINTPRSRRAWLYDALFPTTTILKPFNLSEPLLHDFEEMGPHLARHGVRLDVVTNACLLTPRNLELLLPHLHRITFSFDSHRKEVFERVRPPAVFEEVDRNIRYAMPFLRDAGVLTRINMVLVRDALADLAEFVDYVVDEYGIRYVDVLELVPYMPEAAGMDPFTDPGEAAVVRALDRMVARARERRLNLDLILRAPHARCVLFDPPPVPPTTAGTFEELHQELRKRHPGFCEQVMMYLKVNSDGEAFPCCKAPPELRLGNLFADGVEGVWNSPAAQDLRKRMFRGDYPDPCKTCLFFRFSRATAGAREPGRLSRLRIRGQRAADRAWDGLRTAGRRPCKRVGRVLGLPRILRDPAERLALSRASVPPGVRSQ